MKQISNARPIERFVALDIHREYVMVGGMLNREQEWVLRPRRVENEKKHPRKMGFFDYLGDQRMPRLSFLL